MPEITKKGVYKLIAFIGLLIALAWFTLQITWVVKLLVVSLLIVYTLHPVVLYLKARLRLPHFPAVVLTFLLFLLFMITLGVLIVPLVQNEIRSILAEVPFYARQIQSNIAALTESLRDIGLEEEHLQAIINFPANIPRLAEEATRFSISVFAAAVDTFFVLFIVFYLLYDFQEVRNAVVWLSPAPYRKHAAAVVNIVDNNFGGFIRGNFIRCAAVGILTGILLFIIGFPYALLLGVLAGLLNIILYIGPYISIIPALLLSFSPDAPSIFLVIAIYVFVQAVDAIILSPLLLGRSVKIKAITVIVCMLIGQQLAGFLGMILSTPLAGVARGLIEYFREPAVKDEKQSGGAA